MLHYIQIAKLREIDNSRFLNIITIIQLVFLQEIYTQLEKRRKTKLKFIVHYKLQY